ncbi:FAD-binding oxidoreductase [Glaciimonas sp. PCH181]|uniref:FAD-binding oxidoreductase n=1 Tax=Glaciimonas sp. PCH181 TaxID=2133943 RepID=UPI000D38320C|nr:FAD-binding oxidoreductase [Glaciimonas sp. PCH181]PUA20120.1 hydroxyacid dehydrogenase [Glaciimonas sp. PCH181]
MTISIDATHLADVTDFLQGCEKVVGSPNVLTNAADKSAFLTDQRQRFTGAAIAVVKPGNTAEVAAIVKLCNQFKVPLVPQGGNTGLVLGSVPDSRGNAIVLSLARLNQVRAIDPINHTITVEAGCILQNVQEAAFAADRLLPLSLAAEGSCTIGGNLATNAGGTAVLRYGNTRELCLGLEVVTAQGDIMHGLRGLRKDNTGYDLRDLFIGAEGTLGIITAAVMKIFPLPKAQLTALVALQTPDQALQLLTLAQGRCGAALTGFELMSDLCLQLVAKHMPQLTFPFSAHYPYYVLMEISDSESEAHASNLLEAVLAMALEEDICQDAVLATSSAQSKTLWQLRESISSAQAKEGKNIKHDVSIPISRIAEFISVTDGLLQQQFPGCRNVTFGHLGDGNLHYNVSPAIGASVEAFLDQQTAINLVVHDSVHAFGGSISAEHGIGSLKREELLRYKSAVEMQLMRTIKQALDPLNLMNPGKVI